MSSASRLALAASAIALAISSADAAPIVIVNDQVLHGSGSVVYDYDSISGPVSITNTDVGVITQTPNQDVIQGDQLTKIYNFGQIINDPSTPNSHTGDAIDFKKSQGVNAGDMLVHNYGTGVIEGAHHGITGKHGVTVINDLGGVITGRNGSAINIDNLGTNADRVYVTNYGTLNGMSGDFNDSDGDAIDTDGLLTLDNYGSVNGLGASGSHDAQLNTSEGIAAGGGVINNYAGALIYGVGRAIQIDDSNLGPAFGAVNIVNQGTIQGDGVGPGGLPITSGGTAINILGTQNDVITNKGVIKGSVSMDGGDDTFTAFTGSTVTGLVDGGTGIDTYVLDRSLNGPDADSFGGAANFEYVNVKGGNWTLTGDQTYANNVDIQHGASLYTDHLLMSGQVVAQNGGKLGGSGTFDMIISDGGVLSPGGDGKIGTMTSHTSLSSNGGATILLDVRADGTSDKMVSLGESDNDWMNFDHTHFVVTAAAGNYAAATTYVIAHSAAGVYQGVNGATVEDNFAFLDPELSADDNAYDADHNFLGYGKNLYLTLTRNDLQFFEIAKSDNQVASATAVAAEAGSALYDTVVPLTEAEALKAFSQLAGEVHATVGGALASESGAARDAVGDRVDAAFQALGLDTSGAAQGYAANVAEATAARKFNVWMQGVGRNGATAGDGNASGFRQSTGGLLLGADTALSAGVVAGVFGGLGRSTVELDDLAEQATANNYILGAYAGTALDGLRLKLGGSYTRHRVASTRQVDYQNVNQTLTADYDASTAQIFGEASYDLALTSALSVKPFLGLAYVRHSTDAFTEQGGNAALSSKGSSFGTGIVTIGLAGDAKFIAGDGMLMTLDGAVGWQHSTDAGAPASDVAFAAGNTFTVTGAPIGGDAVLVKAGLSVDVSDSLIIGAGYTGEFGQDTKSHALRASATAKF